MIATKKSVSRGSKMTTSEKYTQHSADRQGLSDVDNSGSSTVLAQGDLQEIIRKRRNERCISGEENFQVFNHSYSSILIICF